MNTTKKELYTVAELEDFSKIEVIDKYVLLAMKYEAAMDDIERMQSFLRLANHNAYGTSSEKRMDQDQLNFFEQIPNGIFNEAEAIAEEAEKVEAQAKPKARRMVGEVGAHKSCFDHLPVEEILHELDNPSCPHCHSHLKELKTVEKRTEIVLIPAKLIKRRHMEKVYACDHCQETGEHSPIIESPTPLPVISGSNEETTLGIASFWGSIDCVELLVSNGANINGSPNLATPLSKACYMGQKEIVKFLIENGADVNTHPAKITGQLPLQQAIMSGSFEIVKLLIEHGAKVDDAILSLAESSGVNAGF